MKVGMDIADNVARLENFFGVKMVNFVDVSSVPIVQRCQPRDLSGLTAIFLNKRWHDSLDLRNTNWQAPRSLSPDQLEFAGLLAWLPRAIYQKAKRLAPDVLLFDTKAVSKELRYTSIQEEQAIRQEKLALMSIQNKRHALKESTSPPNERDDDLEEI